MEEPTLRDWMRFYADYPFLQHRLRAMRSLIDVKMEKDEETGKRPKKSVTLNDEQIHDMLCLIDSFESMLNPLFDEESRNRRREIRRKQGEIRRKQEEKDTKNHE